ncbi:MAG: FKBP-type peptidyl-prolyl cis-trans isomerase FkpA [Bacteroidales bacterium]|jgi:FKBP-type peptidyl-prolyl cis-trans isomerase FkpA|nr:FKBP-type peptidyl-prolyl cis-trans isomerase FkpA [Bacteroidales bacterium]
MEQIHIFTSKLLNDFTMKFLKIVIFFLPIIFFVACDEDDYDAEAQLKKDIALIENYLLENDLTAQSTESGLYYIIEEQGTGSKPDLQSRVTVAYTGKLLNGDVFDSGTITLYVYEFIEGWKEGLQLFNEGGKGQLFVPSTLAYGNKDQETIPANSVLIFDIHLQAVWN